MCVVRLKLLKDPRSCMVSYEISVELQFEFEWLKRAINCSKWAISSQVGMRSLKGSSRRNERRELHNRRTSHLTPTLKNFTWSQQSLETKIAFKYWCLEEVKILKSRYYSNYPLKPPNIKNIILSLFLWRIHFRLIMTVFWF